MLYIENVYNEEEPSILLELYRGIEYCNLHGMFIDSCISTLGSRVFNIKKKCYRTLSNLLSSWMFTLYSYYDFKNDPFFPTKFKYNDNLKRTLNDYCSLFDINDKKIKIKNIIHILNENYENLLVNMNKHKNSDFYLKNKNNITVIKNKIIEKRDNKDIDFYKFEVEYNFTFIIKNSKLKNIVNNLILPVSIYNTLEKKYSNNNFDINYIIWIILFRYQLLSSNNNQLAVLPSIFKSMNTDFNLNFETFGSAINTSTGFFCSLYYDVEKYFGSVGSYFRTQFYDGCYSFNPPYQEDIINNGILKILSNLKKSELFDMELTFILTIPIWDIDGKKIMKETNNENNNNIIKYEDMKIIKVIKKSKYFRGLRMISKNDFTYIDYNFHLFKNKTIQNTYVIVLSNTDINFMKKINEYNFFDYT